MTDTVEARHWLDGYASNAYRWQSAKHNRHTAFYRPLGLVEFCFDVDGRYFEGRADISLRLDLVIDSRLDIIALRKHLKLAWTCLRTRHLFAQVKAPAWQPWMKKPTQDTHEHCFLIELARDIEEAIDQASTHMTFLEDRYSNVDPSKFFTQMQNSARLLDADAALAHLLVLPLSGLHSQNLTCMFVAAHQIGDGISTGRWIPDFTRYLNTPEDALQQELKAMLDPERVERSLPPPQEALYPQVRGSVARQRWFWLLTRILRHVRKPLPAGFENPLLKQQEGTAPGLRGEFDAVLDFGRTPSNMSDPRHALLSMAATTRLQNLCRAAGVSVGAGCFALAAVLMMEFYERQQPDVELKHRKPFITGFPLNPRPFLSGNPGAENLMLAFSDGILLPFLPSYLDLDGRLRLLAKAAQRQLAVYQKRTTIMPDHDGLQYMSSRGAGRMLATQYIGSMERCEMLSPPTERHGFNPQGALAMRPNMTRQTCGVSSVGRRAPLNPSDVPGRKDFKARAENHYACVRARDGEFLIGIAGTDKGIATNISIDGSSVDAMLVDAWLQRFTEILEPDHGHMLKL